MATLSELLPKLNQLDKELRPYVLYDYTNALLEFNDFSEVEKVLIALDKLPQEPGDLTGMYLYMCEKAFSKNKKLAKEYLTKAIERHKKDQRRTSITGTTFYEFDSNRILLCLHAGAAYGLDPVSLPTSRCEFPTHAFIGERSMGSSSDSRKPGNNKSIKKETTNEYSRNNHRHPPGESTSS